MTSACLIRIKQTVHTHVLLGNTITRGRQCIHIDIANSSDKFVWKSEYTTGDADFLASSQRLCSTEQNDDESVSVWDRDDDEIAHGEYGPSALPLELNILSLPIDVLLTE